MAAVIYRIIMFHNTITQAETEAVTNDDRPQETEAQTQKNDPRETQTTTVSQQETTAQSSEAQKPYDKTVSE